MTGKQGDAARGTVFITNDKITKRVPAGNYKLPAGWRYGRMYPKVRKQRRDPLAS